ncbi:hypothetical protein [Corallococcus macrosporus]|uniref:Lipoprotein n=1 Tax=Corallococcus macrosporus DSM 14697 TaxID=1189310 RepID=A0A250K532_9BACT|nr:hypothetical protein [Corallococcus macrosporus]ATB51133.1 hypothetical protein MYMAC_006790 [Corallococcus macrosporus DSM 14697]
MTWTIRSLLLGVFLLSGCKHTGGGDVTPTPTQPQACDAQQAQISREADARAAPWSVEQHLAQNFPSKKVSWLMTDAAYQNFVVKPNARNFGRCNDSGCYLFAAPSEKIQAAVEQSMVNGAHDPAVIGQALGLPAKNFEGPLRMMTLDLAASGVCVRLPVDSDPGVWPCTSEEDKDCFKFGGYTSGGVPELMVIDAPVSQAVVTEIP